jgi:hypothetical protein
MNRDETVALFLQGRKAWNTWAENMLAERKAMEEDGRWAEERMPWGALELKNDETRAWTDAVRADFSRCLFFVQGVERTKETAGEEKKGGGDEEPPVKSISIDGKWIDFNGLIFPGDADFESTAFSSDTNFQSAGFSGGANFRSTAFSGFADFRSAAFSGNADFASAVFSGFADFRSATFVGNAQFQSATFSRSVLF